MTRKGGPCCVIGIIVAVLVLTAFPTFGALTAPFLGPPPNATPGDVDGYPDTAYPQLNTGSLGDARITVLFKSPWSNCAQYSDDFIVTANRNGSGIYDTFTHWGRTFVFDKKDGDGKIIGGTYTGGFGWPNDGGTILLTKSGGAAQTTYDGVSLVGTRSEAGVKRNVAWSLNLVKNDNKIAVQNIAQLGVIKPCANGGVNVDANNQIWLPLGTGDDGLPRVILDINGDGTADDIYFGVAPAVSGSGSNPRIPTLTEWGLGMLVVLFLILGLRQSRKRNLTASG